jgi:hypothetical protein
MKKAGSLVFVGMLLAAQQPRHHRIAPVDLKQRVIWGASCEVPEGPCLAFGGQDQETEDGCSRTKVKEGGEWKAIHDDLRARNPLQVFHDRLWSLRTMAKNVSARARFLQFKGRPEDEEVRRERNDVAARLCGLHAELRKSMAGLGEYEAVQARRADEALKDVRSRGPTPIDLDKISEILDAEPPPRALSPIVYEAATKLFVLFGGDHLDYLTNDTWVFDPAKRRWFQRHPAEGPPPRADHVLKAAGDGKVILSGGYTYTSNTDYCGGQYRDLADGEWTYDVEADAWTGGKAAPPDSRVYRTGRLHPDFFLEGPKPDPGPEAERLRDLPPNLWVRRKPPHLPALNRDWGTAVLDTDRDLILRWSGGHSAHGGTDVLHYHLDTNRWELPIPVEFPLGQLYSNTSYPEGFNFNRRPWVTGHTYQSYGVDPNLKKMLFTGRTRHCYVYDPDLGDWIGRFEKPKGMVYSDGYYTLTLCPTPKGLVCWTQSGKLFRFDAAGREWTEIVPAGAKLPGSVVDNSTTVYDSRRDRLLFARKPYGDRQVFSGDLHVVDLKSGEAGPLSPEGREAAAAIPYLCQIRYDAGNDLFLVGATLPPGPDGLRRTPAYDPAGNRWVSLRIGGEDPSGPKGRNVSLGMMFDAKRGLFWAVDARSEVFVLRLDPKAADLQPLR